MSNKTPLEKMCTTKRRFCTYEAAKWFSDLGKLRIYKCPHCGGYHLTSENRKIYNRNLQEIKL